MAHTTTYMNLTEILLNEKSRHKRAYKRGKGERGSIEYMDVWNLWKVPMRETMQTFSVVEHVRICSKVLYTFKNSPWHSAEPWRDGVPDIEVSK